MVNLIEPPELFIRRSIVCGKAEDSLIDPDVGSISTQDRGMLPGWWILPAVFCGVLVWVALIRLLIGLL